mgnify:CR=1 FL=1
MPESNELSCNLQQFRCACQSFHRTVSWKKDTIALLKRKGVFFCLYRSRTRNAEQNLKGIRIWLVVCPIASGLYRQQCRAEIRTLAQALHLVAIFLLHRLFCLWRLICRKLNHGFCFFTGRHKSSFHKKDIQSFFLFFHLTHHLSFLQSDSIPMPHPIHISHRVLPAFRAQ